MREETVLGVQLCWVGMGACVQCARLPWTPRQTLRAPLSDPRRAWGRTAWVLHKRTDMETRQHACLEVWSLTEHDACAGHTKQHNLAKAQWHRWRGGKGGEMIGCFVSVCNSAMNTPSAADEDEEELDLDEGDDQDTIAADSQQVQFFC